jgi:hypothetical protein
MPDLYDDIESVPSLDVIEQEITGGFARTSHVDRLDCARVNEDYLCLRNPAYIERREGEEEADYQRRPKRTSKLTRKAISTLTSLLYSPGPSRTVRPASAQMFLETVWAKNHINALMRQADRKATLNDACAIQATATGRPDDPIRLYLWGAEEFVPYFRDDDPCRPWAVVTIAVKEESGKKYREYQAWSALEHRVYRTRPIDAASWTDTSGGTVAAYWPSLSGYLDDAQVWQEGINPYGVLPFAFVWNELPVCGFWGSGIGTALRQTNEEIDRELSDIAEHVKTFLNPKIIAKNVSPNFRWKDRPGTPVHITPAAAAKMGEGPADFSLEYLQSQLAVEQAWYDAEKYANATFYELDVPLSAVRDDTSGPSSGIQILAEQQPLLGYTKARQPAFALYEADLHALILRVAGHYYNQPGLVTAADALDVDLQWLPPAMPDIDGTQAQVDQADLDMGLKSRIDLIAERRGITHEEAREVFQRIVEDRQFEQELMAELMPAHLKDANGQPPPDQPDEQDPNDPDQQPDDDELGPEGADE